MTTSALRSSTPRRLSALLCAAATLATPFAAMAQGAPPNAAPVETDRSKDCDSACLHGFADKYLAALAAHDPSLLKSVAPTFRAGENSHAIALGDNIWKTVRKIRPEKSYFTDPFAGQVLVMGVLEMQAAEPFIYSIRLQVEKGLLSEAETLVTSEKIAGQHFRPDLMPALQQKLDAAVAANQRLSRADLLKAARVMLGVEQGSPLTSASDCQRTENGEAPDVGRAPGASACNAAGGVRAVRGFRAPLADVEKGVVVTYRFTDFSDPTPREPRPDAPPEKTPIFYYRPLTFYEMQLVKIADSKYQAHAMFMNAQENGVLSPFKH